MHNVLVKSGLNKYQINYDYNIFLEKCSYQLAKKLIATSIIRTFSWINVCTNYKCYVIAGLILIREVHQKNVVSIFQENWFNFQPYVCNGCHDL